MMLCGNSAFIQCVPNAMLHVILDQGALSQVKDALYSFELLDEVHAGQPVGEHRENVPESSMNY
jgi:hypothetical protein